MKNISTDELSKLVDAARGGEERALAALIHATEKDLFRFLVFLTGNRALAQDIAQDTYIKIIEKLPELRDSSVFSSWLFRTAKNLFIDYKRSPRNAGHEDIAEMTELAANSEQAEAFREAQDLLKPLDPEDRYALLLVYLEGLSYEEAATRLGIKEDALRSRLHRLRQQLGAKTSGAND